MKINTLKVINFSLLIILLSSIVAANKCVSCCSKNIDDKTYCKQICKQMLKNDDFELQVSEMCNFEFSVIDSEKDLLYDFLLESSSEENNPLPYKITIEKSEKNTFDKLLKIILSYLIIRFILSFISWISIISRDQTLGWKIKWFFLTLITGIFGIIIYYFFANKKKITNKTSEESKKNSGTIEVPKYEEPSNQEINVPKFK